MGRDNYPMIELNGDGTTEFSKGHGKNFNNGCHLSIATGFILTLLAILIAVGVGLIVHFAEKGKDVKCVCSMTDFNNPGKMEFCKAEAVKGSSEICSVCPTATTTPFSTKSTSKQSAVTTSSKLSTETTSSVPPVKHLRLPTDLKPIYYDLEMQPQMYTSDPSMFTFTGNVRIVFDCQNRTDQVVLHVNKLNISSIAVGLRSRGDNSPVYVSHDIDEEREFLIVHLDKKLDQGQQYFIQINFTGPLKDDLTGFYLSSYQRGNTTIYLATTQFEATDARKAFPCFDEPAMKAHFNITLVRKKGLTSISNMPRKNTETRDNGFEADVFQSTPLMSTYLVAFVISDFVNVTNVTKTGIEYRIWGRKEALSQFNLALDVGIKVITFFEKYFNILFPLPKQDMVAIPDMGGAMENWGLITYEENTLLYDEGRASTGDRSRVINVIAHELAHQWFGDLVTPEWWSDIWLNEGFADFFACLGADAYDRQLKMLDMFASGMHSVLNSDSLVTSHPIYVPVQNPDEINSVFDGISYRKSGSVLRMLRFFLGDNTFQRGLSRYLKSREYSNANHEDLWAALKEQANSENKPVQVVDVMKTWILQMNYPVVMVTRYGAQQLQISQQRFLLDPNATDPGKYHSDFGYKWDIPFTYTTSGQKNFSVSNDDIVWLWRNQTKGSFTPQNTLPTGNDSWIVGNILQYGFYRVNYEDQNWIALTNQLNRNHTVIDPVNRGQILNDAWNLAMAGLLDQRLALNTLEYLNKERDYMPWASAEQELAKLGSMLRETEIYGAFKNFVRNIITEPYKSMDQNTKDTTLSETLAVKFVAGIACGYDVDACVSNMTKHFKAWRNNNSTNMVSSDFRDLIYCTGVKYGNSDDWYFVYEQYEQATSPSEKESLMNALACSKESWILSMLLKRAMERTDIRRMDSIPLMSAVAQNPVGNSIVWDFLRANWDKLNSEFSVSISSMVFLIEAVADVFNTKFQLSQLEDFGKSHPNLGSGARPFQQVIEATKSNIKWMEKNYPIVKTWLRDLGYLKY